MKDDGDAFVGVVTLLLKFVITGAVTVDDVVFMHSIQFKST